MVHGLSQPSVCATRQLMASKFVWHGIHKQVDLWAKACIPCQTSKVQRHIRAPLQLPVVILTTFTWIWLDPCRLQTGSPISLPWWTNLPGGQRQFPSLIRPPTLVSRHWSHIKLLSRWTCLRTEVPSSHHSCGYPFHSC